MKSAIQSIFVLAALVAAGLLVAQEWDGISSALTQANSFLIALAVLSAIVNVLMTGLSWRVLLRQAPIQLSAAASAQIFFIGQIGKYLPGTVWSFLASGELAKRAGFPRGAAMSSLLLALIIGVASGVAISLMLVPSSLGYLPDSTIAMAAILLTGSLCFLPPIRRALLRVARIDFPISLGSLALSSVLALGAWFFAGAQIILLSQAIEASLPWPDLLFVTGAYAFAWIVGFLVFFAPAGLGAREGGLLATLTPAIGLAEAVTITLLSRLAVTLADFACAGLVALIPKPSTAPEAAKHPHQG